MEVRLDNLSKHFKSGNRPVVKAVDQMNFIIPDGKLVGLLGPSGCGKSTTLYMIAGLHVPTEGKIWFGETDVTEVPPENRGIGLVFPTMRYTHTLLSGKISSSHLKTCDQN